MTATVALLVDAALRAAGIPILGVSIGADADRSTWHVVFDPSATAAQQQQAVTVLATVDVSATAVHAFDQQQADAFVDSLSLVEQALFLTMLDQVNVLRSKLPVPLGAITPAQWIAAVKTKVGTL